MKKKSIITVIVVLLSVLLISVVLMFITGRTAYIGRCVITDDRQCLLIVGDYPVALTNQTGRGDAYSDLETGDVIFVVYSSAMKTSYPGQSSVFFYHRLWGGDISDIPQKVKNELQGTFWFP